MEKTNCDNPRYGHADDVICIYHGNCPDGFAAATVVRMALGSDIEFHAATHGDPPPEVSGKHVIIVDFSYSGSLLSEMSESAESILILDHHKTAAADLKEIPEVDSYEAFLQCRDTDPVCALFDMDRSGAGLAWDFFYPGAYRPTVINHVEDRDLWRFALPHTRETMAGILSYPFCFTTWRLMIIAESLWIPHLRTIGTAILRKHDEEVGVLLRSTCRMMAIARYDVPVANLPPTMASDAGHLMARDTPFFAACYWDSPTHRVFSLRSTDDGLDVSEVAREYGGGGHRNAAGFRVTRHHPLAMA